MERLYKCFHGVSRGKPLCKNRWKNQCDIVIHCYFFVSQNRICIVLEGRRATRREHYRVVLVWTITRRQRRNRFVRNVKEKFSSLIFLSFSPSHTGSTSPCSSSPPSRASSTTHLRVLVKTLFRSQQKTIHNFCTFFFTKFDSTPFGNMRFFFSTSCAPNPVVNGNSSIIARQSFRPRAVRGTGASAVAFVLVLLFIVYILLTLFFSILSAIPFFFLLILVLRYNYYFRYSV